MQYKEEIKTEMNRLGSRGIPFLFLIDFLMEKPKIFTPDDSSNTLLWQTPLAGNCPPLKKKSELNVWNIKPVSFERYRKGFNLIQQHINSGDTYLLNYTQPSMVETNLNLEEIFHFSSAPYKILLKNQFVCFSPETFVKIVDGKLFSFPMKGTIDAEKENAREKILSDLKEQAEHNTIVDLIRNDLSKFSTRVTVEKFRYLERIHTNKNDLWQVSSKISADLPDGYHQCLGDIIFSMLPAGSVSGAPKKKTVDIILAAENYERGYYTGVFGYFDGKNLDSCVLIRFIENENGRLIFKSGGGITHMSTAPDEYDELLKKVYVPVY